MSKFFVIPRMTDINKLLDVDVHNASETKRLLTDFSPDLSEALEDSAQLFTTFTHAFELKARDDAEQRTLDTCGRQLNASNGDELWSIIHSPPPRDPERAKIIHEAKAALDLMWSRRIRGLLLLLSYRSFMFATTDLLRLRVTPSLGHVRVQIEAIGLMTIMRNKPMVASEWMEIRNDKDGQRFFNRYKRGLQKVYDKWGLTRFYNLSSGTAQHARLASLVKGLSQRTFEDRGRQVERYNIKFQELDSEKPEELIMWSISLLRTQNKLFLAIREALYEIDDPILLNIRLPNFQSKIDNLWNVFERKYPDQVTHWKKISEEITDK